MVVNKLCSSTPKTEDEYTHMKMKLKFSVF